MVVLRFLVSSLMSVFSPDLCSRAAWSFVMSPSKSDSVMGGLVAFDRFKVFVFAVSTNSIQVHMSIILNHFVYLLRGEASQM